MNTGIGDAYNLAWKLAFVLRGWAGGESLLDTYNTERLENAKNLLQTTDRAFNFAAQDDFLSRFVRTHVFPVAAEFAFEIRLGQTRRLSARLANRHQLPAQPFERSGGQRMKTSKSKRATGCRIF
jgi:2-polyprenyl-6-methoxyphenol hydroxylase-like FAD-dependent oxidoreductase